MSQTSLLVGVNVDVDRKMCIDVAHLVLVALGDTNNHVGDQGLDGTQSSDVLAGAMVQGNVDGAGDLALLERDGQMLQILLEGATGTGNGNNTGLDLDRHCSYEVPLSALLYLQFVKVPKLHPSFRSSPNLPHRSPP